MNVFSLSLVGASILSTASADQLESSVYTKILVRSKSPAVGGSTIEPWISQKLKSSGKGHLRAVTDWIRLPEKGEKQLELWDAKLDGKNCGCPMFAFPLDRSKPGKVIVDLDHLSPFGGPKMLSLKKFTQADEPTDLDLHSLTMSSAVGSRAFGVLPLQGDQETFAVLLACPPGMMNKSGAPSEPPSITEKIKQRALQVIAFSSAGLLDTPLGQAVQSGDQKTTERLLKEGAKADAKGSWGHSLLHIAASTSPEHPAQSLEITRLLLKAGADVNSASKSGVTPLHEAVLSGSTKLAELLIAKGAKVDAALKGSGHCLDPDHDLVHSPVFGRLREKRTPLSFAKVLKHEELVELLKEDRPKK